MNKQDRSNLITIINIISIVVIVISVTLLLTKPKNTFLENIKSIETTTEPAIQNIVDSTVSNTELNENIEQTEESIENEPFQLTEQELIDLETEVILPYFEFYSGEYQYYLEILDSEQILSNDQTPMYPASLAKLFLMGTIFEAIEDQVLEYDESIEQDLELMITVSDNAAYNRLFFRLQAEVPEINMFDWADQFCMEYDFDDTIIHNLYIIEGNETSLIQSDLVFETSALDVGNFLSLVYHENLVSQEASRTMYEILLRQERTGKIPFLLPDDAITANKTGELNFYSHDAAIICTPFCDYILVLMTDSTNMAYVADEIIRELSLDIYDYLGSID
ncbi:MAG: serine hydrolase [Clostridiaceae bacterium]|jgi:competence protein ComGC|nr:serine hydrolase [Bacillota bacterium]NLN51433.1 serine hydrolase [Clostridiaceae bacterium]